MAVNLHDVPQNWAPADFNHRFGFGGAFFSDAGPKPAGEDHYFHINGPC